MQGQRLRILFVSREYPPQPGRGGIGGGGIGSYVEEMAHALVSRGHSVHILSCAEGQHCQDFRDGGVELHFRGVPRLLRKVRRRLPGTAFRLEGALARFREYRRLRIDVDVIEAPDFFAEGLVFGLLRTRPLVAHLHTPLALVERHNPESFRWTLDATLADRLERFAVRRADVVTCPSRLLARDVMSEGWAVDSEPRVIRYPIDLGRWDELQSPEQSPPRILAVGRLEGRKAPEVLVEAAALLKDEIAGVEVVFLGRSSLHDGTPYRDWLAKEAERLRAPCRFVESVPHSEVATWYATSRVVALPSRYDNFPYAGLEAMASRRPLVCTDQTGVAELVRGTGAGAVVPVDDANALANALRPFLVDPALAGRAGAEARAVVERECAPDVIAERRETCYRETIGLWNTRRSRQVAPKPSR